MAAAALLLAAPAQVVFQAAVAANGQHVSKPIPQQGVVAGCLDPIVVHDHVVENLDEANDQWSRGR
jgi:hypothetical protein